MNRKHPARKTAHSWANSRKKTWWKKIDRATLIKNLLLGSIIIALVGSIVLLGAFAWLSKDLPDPNSLTIREVPQSTKIYDRTGEHLLYEIAGDEKRTLVTLDQIPEYLVWATITAEDRNFYSHSGIDYKGILRAIFVDIITLSKSQGASTITQQLVKNAILSNEKTFTRKFKEVILSLALERRYTKDEIMQLYLNEIPYGSRNYGAQAASNAYYDSDVSDLSLAEAATIASLPRATTYYLNNPADLKGRRDWILSNMAELGYVTQEEADNAMLDDTSITALYSDINAPHFVLWVKENLEDEYGQKEVEQGGMKVITSIDYDMQTFAEEAVVNNRDERSESYGFNNSGLVAIDPNNGHILAMVGSVDYFDDDIDGQVNITQQPLQPGSSFKPIVYTAGFELGYTPNTILWDVDTEFGTTTGSYSPKNYDLQEHGPLTVRSALQGSLNITAVKMLYLVGINSAASFAERLGYTTLTDPSYYGLSMVLGGAEVKLIEHVSAYSVFANEGIYNEPISILKVESADGEILQEWEDSQNENVLDANLAKMITSILSDDSARAPFFGANGYLTLGSRPAAAKTGTTNDYKDAWTIGYTPQLVAGVWTGNTDGSAMNRGAGGSSVAAPIWNEFMRNALSSYPIEYFNNPEIPTTGIAVIDGTLPSEEITIDTASGKLATDKTPESFKETKICGEYHNILYYINPDDPTGGIIDQPIDHAYERWESSVQLYITNYNNNLKEGESPLEMCEIPTEEDDVHISRNEPDVTIKSPNDNVAVEREFSTEIKATARRGIDRIEYQIDGIVIKQTDNTSEIDIELPSWVSAGSHTFTVIAYDDVDNIGSDDIKIKVTENANTASVIITNPFNNQNIENSIEPYTIVIEMNELNILSMTLYAQNLWDSSTSLIKHIEAPSAVNTVDWILPNEGSYLIYGFVTDDSGNDIDIKPIQVSIIKSSAESNNSVFEYMIDTDENSELENVEVDE